MAKIKNGTFFCMYVFSFICLCVIQYRNWPLRSTILNAHGTNASSDGLCTRRHANEAFSSWFCCNSFRVDRARRGNVCLEACLGRRRCSIVLSASSPATCTNMRKNTYVVLASIADSAAAAAFLLLLLLLLHCLLVLKKLKNVSCEYNGLNG